MSAVMINDMVVPLPGNDCVDSIFHVDVSAFNKDNDDVDHVDDTDNDDDDDVDNNNDSSNSAGDFDDECVELEVNDADLQIAPMSSVASWSQFHDRQAENESESFSQSSTSSSSSSPSLSSRSRLTTPSTAKISAAARAAAAAAAVVVAGSVPVEARAIHPTADFGLALYDSFIDCDPMAYAYTRAEFIYVQMTKSSPDTPIGITLKSYAKGVTCISNIASNSVFAKSGLLPGDRIISVNRMCCLKLAIDRIAQLIRSSGSTISITVHNCKGDPNLVSSTVQKPRPDYLVGVAFQNRRGGLYVSRVQSSGLFAGSLLYHDHRCMMINDTICPTARSLDAAQLVHDATDIVTIVSRPCHTTATVLACEEHKKGLWWRGCMVALRGAATGGPARAVSYH